MVAGDLPSSCDIPTGLGKTSVIALWLLALASGAAVPRRLVYVVNRRTVVDQTTTEAERVRAHATKIGIKDLAISTLRGQMADNRAWSADPSRPAVICGTVDMIGSRLLFTGYRIGFRTRPLHAGLLGQDSLIVHDEAHLEPAFQRLLETVRDEQRRCGDPWPLKVMALTATSRSKATSFRIGPEDEADAEVARRLGATKRLRLHPTTDKTLVNDVTDKALRYQDSGRSVLVFLRTVDDVLSASGRLRKAGAMVRELTGTMRGHERDRDVTEDEVLRRFLSHREAPTAAPARTVYLVCTSAGEVGIDLSADHLVCDLSTFDSMAQRFGRVNRFGLREDSEVHVFHPDPTSLDDEKPKDARRRLATLELLRSLDGDASPRALDGLDAATRQAAFSPEPAIREATDVLFDAWAMTSIRERLPGRPAVAPYLHGVRAWEPPRTQIAWRDDVDRVRGALLRRYPAETLLDDYPLKPHELLSDATSRVLDTLAAIAASHGKPAGVPVWLVSETGSVDATLTLDSLTSGDRKESEARLAGATLLLPPTLCRPVDGLLSAEGVSPLEGGEGADVADAWLSPTRAPLRRRIFDDEPIPENMRRIRRIELVDPELDAEIDPLSERDSVETSRSPRYWTWYEVPSVADNEGSRSGPQPVPLDVHSADVEREAKAITARLRLPPGIKRAVDTAARLHDTGKRRRIWQRSIGNLDASRVLAKPGAGMIPLASSRYRHELGSMLVAPDDPLLAPLAPAERELALHLIAAHHGRARPHFPAEELFDPEARGVDMEKVNVEVLTRFAALQRRFGRWGLAYLESLVRAADYAASACPSKVEDGAP